MDTVPKTSTLDGPPAADEASLRRTMEASDNDVAAGLTTPLSDVLDELDRPANRMEKRR